MFAWGLGFLVKGFALDFCMAMWGSVLLLEDSGLGGRLSFSRRH